MTLHETCTQVFNLTIDGFFGGEQFTFAEFERNIKAAFRPDGTAGRKIGNTRVFLIEIAMMDGRWLITINQYSNRVDGFDYTIPDTREQEQRLLKAVLAG